MRNVDVLFWEDGINQRTLVRVLEKYPDLTLFSRKCTFPGFLPDLVVLTYDDPYTGLEKRIEALAEYPGTPILYVRKFFDHIALAALFSVGIEYLVDTSVDSQLLHRFIVEAADTAKYVMTAKKRYTYLQRYYSWLNPTQLSFKELAILGGTVRGINCYKLGNLLEISPVDVNYILTTICGKLHTSRKDLVSVAMLKEYGSIIPAPKYKSYKMRKMRKTPTYYALPQIWEELPS